MEPHVAIDSHALELALLRDGVPTHIRRAVVAVVEHVGSGRQLTEHTRLALGWALAVKPQPAPVDTFCRVRPGEVF